MRCIDPETGNMVGAGPLSAQAAEAQERIEDEGDAALARYEARVDAALAEVIFEVTAILSDLREKLIDSGMQARGFERYDYRY